MREWALFSWRFLTPLGSTTALMPIYEQITSVYPHVTNHWAIKTFEAESRFFTFLWRLFNCAASGFFFSVMTRFNQHVVVWSTFMMLLRRRLLRKHGLPRPGGHSMPVCDMLSLMAPTTYATSALLFALCHLLDTCSSTRCKLWNPEVVIHVM